MKTRHCGGSSRWLIAVVACSLLCTLVPAAWAGGSPENVLLIIDPSSNDSLYVGNYYKNARHVPDQNVLYMAPGAVDYATFADLKLDALSGFLANSDLADHVDYVVLMPGSDFYVPATGYVSDGCYAVTRFAISAAYSGAFLADEILAGGLPSTTANGFEL